MAEGRGLAPHPATRNALFSKQAQQACLVDLPFGAA
jgi:hypothetical protein